MPLERAESCLYVIAGIFGVMTLTTICGMGFYLTKTGFFPEERVFNQSKLKWEGTGEHHFSPFALTCAIMLGLYFVPIVLRLCNFCNKFCGYIFGFIAYLLLIPMFTNMFQIYAMSNLHDLSWGNRPPSSNASGAEVFSANRRK